MLGHLTCYACGDSWCRDLIDLEVQSYIEEHPESEKRILSGDVTDVDLGETLCDGCEDEYYQEQLSFDNVELDAYYNALTMIIPFEDDNPSEDIEDEIDRKADLMAHGRI